MVQGLTKQDLINWGITVEQNEDGSYTIYRTGLVNGFSPDIVTRELSVTVTTCRHKYGKDKQYPYVVFSVNSKPKGILVSRLMYAWFVGDIPDGYDIDHIDNNPFNNNPENLQILTRKENLIKRGPGRNQWTANMTDEEILARRSLIAKKKEINSMIHDLYHKINKTKEMRQYSLTVNNTVYAKSCKRDIAEYKERLKALKKAKKDINQELK